MSPREVFCAHQLILMWCTVNGKKRAYLLPRGMANCSPGLVLYKKDTVRDSLEDTVRL